MKKLVGLATAMVIALALHAPSIGFAQQVDTRMVVAKTEQAREEVVRQNLNLTPQEAEEFWRLYKTFRAQLGPVKKNLINLVVEYADLYPNLSDAQATSLFERSIKLREKESKIRSKYFKKFRRLLSAKHAIRYAQIERKLDAALEFEAALGIPLVE